MVRLKQYIGFGLYLTLNMFFILFFLIVQSDFIISGLFLVWANITVYAVRDLKSKGMLFAFCVAFFSFLMGRHLLSYYFNYEVEVFSEEINTHAELCILLSLLTVFFSYIFFYVRNRRKNKQSHAEYVLPDRYIKIIRKYSLRIFWVAFVFSVIYAIFIVVLVHTIGYLASYTVEGKEMMRGNYLLLTLNRIEQALPVAFCCYLATFPERKSCNKICMFYFLYLALTLLGGQRGPFILGTLFLMIYYFYRNKREGEIWIKKSWIRMGLIAFPFLLVGLGIFSKIRTGDKIEFSNVGDSIVDFVYNNGVSVNVIKRSYELDSRLRSDRFYSLHFLHDGVFGLVFGSDGAGNNADKATEGYHLAHALPYLMFRDKYLEGAGTGTSYIAELYHDFGYIGIVLGNVIYGFLLASLAKLDKNKPFNTSVKLLIITRLLWAPRGGFTEFITILSLSATIFIYVAVFLGAFLVFSIPRRRYTKLGVG